MGITTPSGNDRQTDVIHRDIFTDPPVVYAVRPNGNIRSATAAPGINHYLVHADGTLRQERIDEGYLLLRECYEQDPLGERGWQVWCDYVAARKAGKKAVLDDGWLPRVVIERRAKRRDVNTWQCPPVPKFEAVPDAPKKRVRVEKLEPPPKRDDDPVHDDGEDLPLPGSK